MTWIFIFFWALVGAFCIYIVIDINRTKTNDEKILRIKQEMERVDKMNDLNTKMIKTREKTTQEWVELYEYGVQIYEDVKTYMVQTTQTIIQFIVDIFRRRVYAFVG
jgi:hypothetical protein